MSEVTIKLDSPIITTDKSISEITTDGLANTGEIALATDGIVGNVNGALRKYPNPIKTFYVKKFVATGMAKWGFEPKDVKTNDVVMIKTATENLMFTVAEATESKAILCAFTKNGGTRIVMGQKVGSALISYSYERVADYYSGKTYEYSLSEDLSLTGVTPFTKIEDAERCVPSYYTNHSSGKNYLRLKYNSEELLPIGASYNNSSGHSCVFYFIINHKGQQKLVVFQVSAFLSDDPITTSLSFVDLVRIDALDNGDASSSFVAGRNLKVNGWEFYWKDIWEESEPSAIKHIESAGVNAAINEIKGTGIDVSAFMFPTTKDEFIAYLKTITFDFSNQPNQVSGYGSITYGIMNKNAGTTTIVEGMRNAVPNKIHRSHIEGQHMTFPDVEYALDCHVEGQDCNIVGYASICHLEGNSSAVVHSMEKNVGFFTEACACHVEGGGGVAGGAYSHVEGDGCAALNNGAHCEGKGYYKNNVTDWKKRTAKDNDYLKDLWKKILFGKTNTSGYTYKFSAAIGNASHVEGTGNIAPKASATLEGLDTGATASFVNGANHAEGAGNLAGAAASHAEGIRNEIGDNAYASHAEGIKNTTKNRAEHASGQYNKSSKATDTFGDAGNTLFSVGCGTSDADRKNAFEVMQDGTCKYLDVATGEQINVGVAKELSKPFDLTIGSTTKKVDGKSAVSFDAVELGIKDKSNAYIIDTSSGTPEITLNINEEVDGVEEYLDRVKHVAVSSEFGFDGMFYLNCTLHLIYGDDDRNALLDLTGVGRLADRIVKIFLEYKTVYNSSSNTYKLLDKPERYSIKQFENYELVLSDITTIDTTNSILPTTKAGWIALRNEPDVPIILKLSIGTYKCVGVTETGGVYHFEFILNNQDAQSQFGVYKLIVDTTPDTITQTVEYIDRMPKSTVNAFNGALILNLTTASTEADIRKAFTEVNTKTVLFPTPGSIISKLDGGNKGIVVSLSKPDVTTLGRTITVYHGNDTYTIIVKSDFTKVLMPWSKISSKRNIYSGDISGLTSDLSEADIKGLLTPLAYQKYNIIYPVKPQTGDLMEEVTDDGESRFITITALRNQENPDEYTDIIIPCTGKDNRVYKIVLKNDLSRVQSSKRTILENYRRSYDGKLLLTLDTVKAETIENSILDAYSYSVEQIGIAFEARLPKVGDLITIDNSDVPVCEVFLDSDDVQHTRWFYEGKLYEVTVNTALTRVPEDPKVVYNSKKIYDGTLLSILGDTTDEARIKKAFTPKGYTQPVIPDSGDIAQDVESSIILSSVQGDEFYIYIYGPQNANLIVVIQCNKNFTTVKSFRSAIRMSAYQYDGQALLSTEITTPSDIKLLYTPVDVIYGYKSAYGAESPKVGDIIAMPTKPSENIARGIVVDAVETDNTYITRWFYGGKLYEAEVTKDFTSIPKYGKVIYDTTSGTLRDLYISAGAVYNEATGYYELNGLTDITEEEMKVIWQEDLSGWYLKGRTNLTRNIEARGNAGGYNGGIDISNMCLNNRNITIFNFFNPPFIKSMDNAFSNCIKLKTIDTRFPINPFGGVVGPNTFRECTSLEEVRFNMRYLSRSTNVDFPASSLISKDSVLSIIETTPTTGSVKPFVVVGLNESAYNRLKDDTDIQQALTEKNGFVTLTQI